MVQARLNNQKGVATLIALLMLGMLMLIGLAALSTSDDEVTIAGNELQEMRAFYAAEAGLEKITAVMQQEYDSTGAPPLALPAGTDSLNLCEITYAAADDGPASQKILTSGSMSGLHALVKSFSISSRAVSEVVMQLIGDVRHPGQNLTFFGAQNPDDIHLWVFINKFKMLAGLNVIFEYRLFVPIDIGRHVKVFVIKSKIQRVDRIFKIGRDDWTEGFCFDLSVKQRGVNAIGGNGNAQFAVIVG